MSTQPSRRMDRQTFARSRAAALRQIRNDPSLTSTAKLVGCQIAEEYLNPNRRGAWPSNARIGHAIGKHARTVQRSLRELQVAGHVETEQRIGQSNLITFPTIEAAAAAESKSLYQTGHSCPEGETDLSGLPRHQCQPNLTKEPKKEPSMKPTLSFPRYPLSPWSKNASAWEEALERHGIPPLDRHDLLEKQAGKDVLILPAPWPPSDDDAESWRRTGIYFKDRAR